MSKYLYSLCILFLVTIQHGSAQDDVPNKVEATPPISEVLVSPGRAVITRNATVTLRQGVNQIRVKGLPPALDRESLQVDLPQDSGVQLKAVALKLIATRKLEPERIQTKEKELVDLERQLKDLEDQHQLLGAELLVIQKFSPGLNILDKAKNQAGAVARRAALDPNSWMAVIEFSGNLAEAKRQAIAELSVAKKELKRKRELAKSVLSDLRKTSVPARVDAFIDVTAGKAATVRVTLRYTVRHVTWYPAYELKASTDGRKVTVERQAMVAQHTGEDWSSAQLTFSTLPPENAVSIPSLHVLNLSYGDVHGAVESREFGHQRPQAEAMAALARIPGPEALMALRKAHRGRGLGGLAKAFGYRDLLGEASIALGEKSMNRDFSYGHRGSGARRRMALRCGGGARTESSVDAGLNYFANHQRANGSWNDLSHERHAVGATSLCLLSYMGAGHTPKVGKYKVNVRRGLEWLMGQIRPSGQVGTSLFDQCHAVLALGEGYAMSRQRRWGEGAVLALRHLDRMLRPRVLPLIPGMMGSRFPNGIENLAFASMAVKSCRVAGLRVPLTLLESLKELTRQLGRSKQTARSSAVAGLVLMHLGYERENLKPYVDRILKKLPNWDKNRFHVGYMQIASLVCFQYGGEVWSTWNNKLKAALLGSHDSGNGWPAEGAWVGPTGSRILTSAFCITSLEIYYRYLPVYKNGDSSGDQNLTWQPVSPLLSSNGRLYYFRADGLRSVTGDGEFHRIPINRTVVDAKPSHVTAPVVYQGVFLQTRLSNPFKAPMLEGAARIFLGHEFMGEIPLKSTLSGQELVVPLGEDPYVLVTREVFEETSKNPNQDGLYTLQAKVRLTIENRRKTPVELRAKERYAVSFDPRVRVRNRSILGGEAHETKKDGTFFWDVKLKPNTKEIVEVSYEVEYPELVVPQPKRVE